MKFRKKKKLAQERAIRNMVRREMDKLVEELEKRAKNVELPEEVKAKMIPDEQYANARMVEDQAAWDETAKTLGTRWQEEVIAYAK